MTGARGDATPRVVGRDGATPLVPIELDDERIDEGWLRSLLHTYPDVLPVERIGLRWGPLVSVGCDMAVGGVVISNLFVSPTGELTIAEPALWSNPSSRVDAVRRIVAIASAVSELTFADFEAWIDAKGSSERSLWERAQEGSTEESSAVSEALFVDNVAANLAAGDFLLLIVGDGIRSDFDEIATAIGDHPHLSFHFELVELRVFHWSEPTAWVQEDRILVVPTLLGRTTEVARTVNTSAAASTAQIDLRDRPQGERRSSRS